MTSAVPLKIWVKLCDKLKLAAGIYLLKGFKEVNQPNG